MLWALHPDLVCARVGNPVIWEALDVLRAQVLGPVREQQMQLGFPRGCDRRDGEAPQLVQADTTYLEIPRGWKSVLLRYGFTGGLKMDTSREAQLEHGPSLRMGSTFPPLPGWSCQVSVRSPGPDEELRPHPGESLRAQGKSSPCCSCSVVF